MEIEEMFEVNAFSEPVPWWLTDEAALFSSNGNLKITEKVAHKSWLSAAIKRMKNLIKKGGE